MIVGVAAEAGGSERRVALVPASVTALAKAGAEVLVQTGAGVAAGFADAEYEGRGARLVTSAAEVFEAADLIVCLRVPGATADGGPADANARNPASAADTADAGVAASLQSVRSGQVIVGLLDPWNRPAGARDLAGRGATTFALELLPRISRAQSMDALSSMATVAGYKAVLLAAESLGKMFPMMITAAGTLTPARALVVGAGVAGLQAIATARRLGAVVVAYDIRPDVKEQIESLGATFLELDLETGDAEDAGGYAREMDEDFYRRQREMMAGALADTDVAITTASIPGKKAPILITEAMVRGMPAGAVIVDLAAETGGNCELTRAGEIVEAHGVSILGPRNLAASVPHHASQMYSKNVTTFVEGLIADGVLALDFDDEIVAGSLLTHEGQVVNTRVKELLGERSGDEAAPADAGSAEVAAPPAAPADAPSGPERSGG